MPEGLHIKAMTAVTSDTDNNRFVIGSSSLQRPNELHFLTYSEDANRISVDKIFRLPDKNAEVTQLRTSPINPEVVVTALSSAKDHKAVLYACKEQELEEMITFKGKHRSGIHSLIWEGAESVHEISYTDLIMADQDVVSIFDVNSGQVKLELEATLDR